MPRPQRNIERIEIIGSPDHNQTLIDLSEGGLCYIHAQKFSAGDRVKVQLEDLALSARIAYCQDRKDGFRVGLEFSNVPAGTQKRIKELADNFSRGVPVKCAVNPDNEKAKA